MKIGSPTRSRCEYCGLLISAERIEQHSRIEAQLFSGTEGHHDLRFLRHPRREHPRI